MERIREGDGGGRDEARRVGIGKGAGKLKGCGEANRKGYQERKGEEKG